MGRKRANKRKSKGNPRATAASNVVEDDKAESTVDEVSAQNAPQETSDQSSNADIEKGPKRRRITDGDSSITSRGNAETGEDPAPTPSSSQGIIDNSAALQTTSTAPTSTPRQITTFQDHPERHSTRGGTLWGKIIPQDLVFARRSDTWFYSGEVTIRDELCPLQITFDDGIILPVPESEVVPIRVLGAGTPVMYPTDTSHRRNATVLGQNIELNEEAQVANVQYELQVEGEANVVVCTRTELCFDENTFKVLRQEYDSLQEFQAGTSASGSQPQPVDNDDQSESSTDVEDQGGSGESTSSQ